MRHPRVSPDGHPGGVAVVSVPARSSRKGDEMDTEVGVSAPVRVMVEQGKKKRAVASAFDWPGWDRSAKSEDDALTVLAAYRPRYAKVADLAGHGDEFARTGDLMVVERLQGT